MAAYSKPKGSSSRRMAVAVCGALFMLAAQSASAQQPEIDALAAKLGKALSDAQAKKVVVFDFTGPGKDVTQFGVLLADQLSAALASAETDYTVVDRTGLTLAFQKQSLASDQPWDTGSLELVRWIAGEAGAKAFVIGAIADDSKALHLTVDSYLLLKDKRIGGFGVGIPKTLQLEALLSKGVATKSVSVPVAGRNGYTVPKCGSCPIPNMGLNINALTSSENPISVAYVVLKAVISLDGWAREIRVVGSPGSEFTKEAIMVASRWRFIPARGPGGKPAPVELSFYVPIRKTKF